MTARPSVAADIEDDHRKSVVGLLMRCTFGEVEKLAKLAEAAQKTKGLAEYMKLAEFAAGIRKRK